MASIDRLTSRRSVLATIGSALALGVAGYGSARQNDRADESATEPARTATSDERDDSVATDESSDAPTTSGGPDATDDIDATGDPDATGELAAATDDEADCGCPG